MRTLGIGMVAVALGGCEPARITYGCDEPVRYYWDLDQDGHAGPHPWLEACVPLEGWYAVAEDCDDGDPEVHPDADEYCNGVDDDCNGTVDDDYAVDALAWHLDGDGDGFGRPTERWACECPSTCVDDDTDCDDRDSTVYPGAEEICEDGVVNDCEGTAEEALDLCGGLRGDLSEAPVSFFGVEEYSYAGYEVAGAGDVNADGFDDILVGAPWDDSTTTDRGAAYLVLGSDALSGEYLLTEAATLKLVGESEHDLAGFDVAGAGDVDADGYDDILVGAVGEDTGGEEAGAAYLVLGSPSPAGELDLSAAHLKLVGVAPSEGAGTWVSGAGDVDEDGHADLLVGAPGTEEEPMVGAAYLVPGDLAPGVHGLADVATAILVGVEPAGRAGTVAEVGDFDGSGSHHLLVGARWEGGGSQPSGAAYLVPAHSDLSGELSLGEVGIRLLVPDGALLVGFAGAGAGDVDGDGYEDALVGAPGSDLGSGVYARGAAFLVLGSATVPEEIELDRDATFMGEAEEDWAGLAVAGAGDVDGDGSAELMVSASLQDRGGENAGAVYLLLGPVGTGVVDLGAAQARLLGEQALGYAGQSVAGAGDVDDDGLDDVLIGAPFLDYSTGTDAGAVYLFRGETSY